MHLGRSIVAIAGSCAASLVGLFLMVSPWVSGIDNGHGPWSLATKTDFWSGMGVLVVGVTAMLLYRAGLTRELQVSGLMSRSAKWEEPAADPAPAEPTPMNDDALLALATSVANDVKQHQEGAVVPEGAMVSPPGMAVTEAELVRMATELLGEIQSDAGGNVGTREASETPKATESQPSEPPEALMSEAELVTLAANLLDEIQRTRPRETVSQREGHHES